MAANYKAAVNGDDLETHKMAPRQWQPLDCLEGTGLLEYQGFEAWTKEEQSAWRQGELSSKWAVGQVTLRLPINDTWSLLAVMYGFVPFIVPLWWALSLIAEYAETGTYHLFPCFGLGVAVTFAVVNEAITKQVCKLVLGKQLTSRPAEAVCKKPGMPSGHVMNSYTLMTWTFLEVVTDTVINIDWLIIIILLNALVPWARVYNKDHTYMQVMVSASIAFFMGVFAFSIRKSHFPQMVTPWHPI